MQKLNLNLAKAAMGLKQQWRRVFPWHIDHPSHPTLMSCSDTEVELSISYHFEIYRRCDVHH